LFAFLGKRRGRVKFGEVREESGNGIEGQEMEMHEKIAPKCNMFRI